ncbi:MAG TPA: MOSC domain-containing protein [Myxococcales bacterium]|nr:MOSC domain-containing protein [Myxococcales bacterium]
MGRLEHIHLAAGMGEPMRAVERARAVSGVGLEGDRYATGRGHFSNRPGTGRHLTLIEAEVIDGLRSLAGISLSPGDARRNLTTRGIDLNALVGKRFRIGEVLCEGVRLCDPCQYLEDLLGKPVRAPLAGRGGLRAHVLEGGELRVGDPIES